MEVSGQVHAPVTLASGKESPVEIEKEAWCVYSQFERRDDVRSEVLLAVHIRTTVI